MKFLAITFAMILAVGSVENSVAAVRADTKTPDAVIKAFYTWYINSIDAEIDPFVKGRATLRKYVTLRLIKQIEREEENGAEADAFLQTQEWSSGFVESMTVSKAVVKGTAATAIVSFGKVEYPRIAVSLTKEAGVWKIDQVKNAAR
ncbi:MAG: DUF3828 domain-containing protein [Acidobacteriota bacterium]